jgi:hypothetical protein
MIGSRRANGVRNFRQALASTCPVFQCRRLVRDLSHSRATRGESIMRTLVSRLTALLLVALLVAGCAARVRNINDLRSNPARYHDRTVSLEGVVTSAWGVPLVPFKVYRIEDGTGDVTVISQNARTPTRGARVRVTGTVNEVAVLGGQSFGLHVREERLSVLSR